MKKLLFTVAVLLSAGTATFAQSNDSIPPVTEQVVVAEAPQCTYKEVKMEELNENTQAAIKEFTETYNIHKLEYDESQKQTRVTLEDKSNQTSKEVILNEEGKEVK